MSQNSKISVTPKPIPIKTEIITERIRNKPDSSKIAVMHDMLNIIANEDVNEMFIKMLNAMQIMGYNLKDTPERLLAQITETNSE